MAACFERVAVYIIFSFYFCFTETNCLTDITSKVFNEKINGVLAAFGDFNSDKFTDVFIITNEGKTVEVLFGQEKEPYLIRTHIKCDIGSRITSVVPGDFDGDSRMDVLITHEEVERHSKPTVFQILWGSINVLDCNFTTSANNLLKGQPLVIDYNGDRIPDLYGESEEGKRQVWIMHSSASQNPRNFTIKPVKNNSLSNIRSPHSNAFIDLNNDMFADLLVTTEDRKLEIWLNMDGKFSNSTEIQFDIPEAKVLGQSAFLDVDLDGEIDHIVPICFDEDCHNSSIYIYRNKKWLPLTTELKEDKYILGFYNSKEQPITLRIGDYNLDGFPDLLTVLCAFKNKTCEQVAYLFLNLPCNGCQYNRRFEISTEPTLKNIKNVMLAAFYDIFQDGILDILLVSLNNKNHWKITALQNDLTSDVFFIKVFVLSGLCYADCPHSNIPYGVNQPGPFIRYKTTKPDGSSQISCAGQISQSAHFSLQLPYTIFGLGQTSNFIDELHVGIPRPTGRETNRYAHSWTGIIPNSQMIIIPHLQNSNNRWLNKLFVTPSHQVFMTFIALAGTCVFIVIVIAILHWKERRADWKEKLQNAHKFHFDAM